MALTLPVVCFLSCPIVCRLRLLVFRLGEALCGCYILPQVKTSDKTLSNMHMPQHPGEVLVEYLDGLSGVDAAAKIGIGHEHLSRLLDRQVSIDAKLAGKLGRALGTSAELWLGMQAAYDLSPDRHP